MTNKLITAHEANTLGLPAQFEKGWTLQEDRRQTRSPKMPLNRKRRIKTIFNHFRNKHARLKIHFHTLRHWKATMEYHRTKDILYVMKLLGHKNIANTLIYTQLVEFEDDDKYHSATASTVEEAQKLIESGFEFVCTHGNVILFRKRK